MSYELYVGDCLDVLDFCVPDKSVHCCVTSPPYFGLRDYGHEGQIGLEETPETYVAKLVEVFRAVRRVLRDDGTLWLNVGDSYANNGGGHGGRTDNQSGVGAKRVHDAGGGDQSPRRAPPGLKPKDLIGIPWMVAFALRADGWFLRQDIIWAKPNPMPESVRDRCTKSHEYIFLLAKNPNYYFDAGAIKEQAVGKPSGNKSRKQRPNAETLNVGAQAGSVPWSGGETRNRRSVWTVTPRPFKGAHFATFPPELIEPCVLAGCPEGGVVLDPFAGSGTTAGVALKHKRKAILCEINPEYAAMVPQRVQQIVGGG